MEGGRRGLTPSRTRWCSLPSLRPVTVTLNAGRASACLEPLWKYGVRNTHMHSWPVSACAVPGCRGLVGFPWHYCMKGSELGLHSTGVCLSFCLIAFYYYCVIFLSLLFHHPGNHLPNYTWFICFTSYFNFLVRTQYLCTKCFPCALSCLLDQDSCRMNQVAWVLRFLGF